MIARPLSIRRLGSRVPQLEEERAKPSQFQGMVSRNPLMLEVFARIRRVAPHFRTVLVSGATGTGKELVAHALRSLGPLASAPFAVCNCSAIVETLLESELFGHVRGAFTGAMQDKTGLFEHANGGTVFLDEIGDMPLAAQAKLLRVLQNQEIQPVGSPAVRRIDVRVVAATNRDLRELVEARRFREDLYYRLAGVEIRVPKLAERREDLPLLQRHFLERFAKEYGKPVRGFSRRAAAALARYHWPGNIRELENAVAHACMMAEGDLVDLADLPESVRRPAYGSADDLEVLPLEELERRQVRRVLEQVGGNKVKAVGILGISRGKLYRILRGSEPGQDPC